MFSCSSIKKTEHKIVNDFLKAEFAKDRYKSYLTNDLYIVAEKDQCTPILAYEYAFNDMKEFTKIQGLERSNYQKETWVLDSIGILSIKERCKIEKTEQWTLNDFDNFNFKLISKKEYYLKIRVNGIEKPEKNVITLSKPYIIKNKYALIYFQFQSCGVMVHTIERFTTLLKKIDGKWVISASYWDGIVE